MSHFHTGNWPICQFSSKFRFFLPEVYVNYSYRSAVRQPALWRIHELLRLLSISHRTFL